jgi:hypothetical protein
MSIADRTLSDDLGLGCGNSSGNYAEGGGRQLNAPSASAVIAGPRGAPPPGRAGRDPGWHGGRTACNPVPLVRWAARTCDQAAGILID